jgi:ribosomal protein S21
MEQTLCYYLKRRMRKNNRTNNRPLGFHGYYVDVPPGGDAVRAYRKIKRWIKEDKFIEQIRDKSVYSKPSAIKREKRKERAKTLRKLQRQRNENLFMGRTNRR